MKALISIPVHEKPEVICDQIANINKYFPEAAIVLHISASYFEKWSLEELGKMEGVYMNPRHLTTSWGDIVLPHLCNFNYAEELGIAYDYFVMHSSNDMYVCKGVASYMEKYDAGFHFRYMRQKDTYWWPCAMAYEDPWIARVMAEAGQTKIVASQVEGSFYRRDIIQKVMGIIQKTIDLGADTSKKGHYTREEFFFSTIAETLVPYERVGHPIVFSEVHRFDRELWNVFKTTDRLYGKYLHYFLPRKLYDRMKGKYNQYKFNKGAYKITPQIVDRIRQRDVAFIEKNRYLNDGAGTVELYGKADTLFAVKRVARELNDPLRKYIRQLD